MRLRLSLLSVVLGFLFLGAQSAHAKTSRKVSHSYEKVWPTAVRFLRIDEGHKLLEKDMENGYLLFEIAEEGKLFQASVELIRRKDASNREAVELILSIKDRPSYMEHGILDRMLLKIRKELGLPKDPPADVSDGETEGERDEEPASPSTAEQTVK
ncbi:MAG: hypothetical protein GY811_00520 [Myxococcales bacterium]|nr:hypothetical protein [Myxococcales bacterium]